MAAKPKTKRALDLGAAVDEVNKKLRELAIKAHAANVAKNAAEKDEKQARGELLGMMKNLKLKSKIFEGVETGGKTISLEATIARSARETTDILALAQLVEKDLFMQIVKANKGDVIELAGEAVFQQVKKVSEGEENVTVKPLK